MAKKKTKQMEPKVSLSEALGMINIFNNEKVNFIIGLLLLFFSLFMILAFVSFFTSGAADQSLIENLRNGDLANEERKFVNICGSYGAYIAYFFMNRCFGIAAFFIPFFLLLLSVSLTKAYKVNLLKWFFASAVLMIWSSVLLSSFLSMIFSSDS